MSWIKEISIWDTLFELKKTDAKLGLESEIFFATDFAKDIQTDEFKTVIAYPAFNGMDLGKGIGSFIVTKEELEEKFTLIDKTFTELELEYRKEFFESSK